MKRGGEVHTVPAPGEQKGWWNKQDGRVLSKHRTKEIAVATGRQIAKQLKVEHAIHTGDGRISDKNSYGNDAFPPKG